VTFPDPDAVQVLAAALHAVECLPGAIPYSRYSVRHHEVHARRARLVLARTGEAGYHLTTKES
jgi:hypothetical protein